MKELSIAHGWLWRWKCVCCVVTCQPHHYNSGSLLSPLPGWWLVLTSDKNQSAADTHSQARQGQDFLDFIINHKRHRLQVYLKWWLTPKIKVFHQNNCCSRSCHSSPPPPVLVRVWHTRTGAGPGVRKRAGCQHGETWGHRRPIRGQMAWV